MTRRPCHYRRRSKKKHRNNTISSSSTGTRNDNDVTRLSVLRFFLRNLLFLLPIWTIPEISLSSFLVFYAQFNHAPSTTLAAIMIRLPFSLVVTSSVLFLFAPVFIYLLYIFQLMATYPPLAILVVLTVWDPCAQQCELPAGNVTQSMGTIFNNHSLGTIMIYFALFCGIFGWLGWKTNTVVSSYYISVQEVGILFECISLPANHNRYAECRTNY